MRNRFLLTFAATVMAIAGNLAAPERARAAPIGIEAQGELTTAPTSITTKGGASADCTSPVTTALVAMRGNTTFSFTALSTASGGTVCVYVQFWALVSGSYVKVGVADVTTLTVTDGPVYETISATKYYPATEVLSYAALGATHAEIRPVDNPSGSATAILRQWVNVAAPRGQ